MTTHDDWLGGASAPPTPTNRGGRPAKDYSARGNRRLECPSCGFNVRTSALQIRQAGGTPSCACGARMILSELRDRYAIEPAELEAELATLGRDAYDDAMRELGETVERERGSDYGRGGASQARCQWDQGYCMKFVSGRYCPEHDPHELAKNGRATRKGC